MAEWARDAIFYHMYPLGLCDAPRHNSFGEPPVNRLSQIESWIEHLRSLGVNALYLGPLFESTAHGYDTADYYRVDRRLGDNRALADLVKLLHDSGIRVILDGVFHHVGRDFWAFRDLQTHGEHSAYRDWFVGVDFGQRSPYGDPFAYAGWNGHYDLVKLNLHHPDVRAHLFGAVRQWIDEFGIDDLRLDVADELEHDFLRELASFCRGLDAQFWLMGEAIHGDYRRHTQLAMLDSVTNYESYKGLYSSLNDRNYFEIAYALNRQFGEHGIYRDLPLYAFVDNHDVPRVASVLRDPRHLYPLYALLFSMPGVPSVYYGSEWGIGGVKQGADNWALRPALRYPEVAQQARHPDLAGAVARFAQIRHESAALLRGSYRQLHVAAEQFAFAREKEHESVVVLLNAGDTPMPFDLALPEQDNQTFVDLLEPQEQFTVTHGRLRVDAVASCWARILARR